MKHVLATLFVVLVLATAGAALVTWRGWYDVSATGGHTALVNGLLETGLRRSVQRQARPVQVPQALDDPARVARGAACYRQHCEQCHGGPGVAPSAIGMSLQPLPGPLVDATRRWAPQEIYWITRHGIKMTGMPAWELRLADEDLWAVTAFVQQLHRMPVAQYRASADPAANACPTANESCAAGRCASTPTADAAPLLSRSADEAAHLMFRQYACVACHRIPGVVGPQTDVGPPLDGMARRERIAGRLPATVDDLARFIQHPRSVDAETAMPELGVTGPHAHRMAEYLLAQH